MSKTGVAEGREAANQIHNPYLAARREWDERYGDLITRARIAVGSVAMKRWRLEPTERLLAGMRVGSPEMGESVKAAFADARSFRKVEADEITGATTAADEACRTGCDEYVAIECTR